MENLLFSNLVYRIIGEPEKWQEASIEKVHAFVDQTVSLDTKENLQELEIANNIIERISSHDDILNAFQSFLENSRYGLIILGEDYSHIYHNQKAQNHLTELNVNSYQLKPNLINKVKETIDKNTDKNNQTLLQVSLNGVYQGLENVYVKVTRSDHDSHSTKHKFHVLFLPIFEQEKISLNDELKTKYKLSAKEESVIISVIEGKNIKQISEQNFISQNTVKSHLKSIYYKTSTNSQSALIRLFLNHEAQLLDSYFDFKMPSFSDDSHFNKHTDLFAVLTNKSSLCYRDTGPRNGKPLIVLHNSYACRFNLPANADSICEQTNRRIIIPDRPGYGQSPFINGYPDNLNSLLSELVDYLELDEFDLLGNILGSTHAIRYCQQKDKRLKKVILTSPVFVNQKEHRKYLGDVLLPASRVVNSSKRIAAEVYKLWLRSMSLNVEKHMRHLLSSSLGTNEQHLLDDPDFINIIVKNFTEAQKQSSSGNIQDLLYCLQAQQIDLSRITTPVTIWVGDQDKLISVEGAKDIFNPIPDHTLHIKQGYGQDIYYSLFADIIA